MRAVHIEKLDDMATESFINALNRFFFGRGRPETITLDNGRNFVKANSELAREI